MSGKEESMGYTEDMREMCETLSEELSKANKKIRSAGGALNGSDVEYVDKLSHAIKSLKTAIAMAEAEEGTSGYDNGETYSGTYRRMSYARGRRRDSMGRYSSRGYSGNDEMIAELRDLMEDAPDERVRGEFQRFISKIENM